MLTRLLALLVLIVVAPAAQGYADEDRDWGVPPGQDIRSPPYSAPTPLQVPGARVIRTDQLKQLVAGKPPPLLIDVAAGEGHVSLEGAVWLPNAGRGVHYVDPVQAELAAQLATLTGEDKAAALVFFCVNSQCWLSYNAALRAAALGYTQVYWYRGGIESWRAAGLPLARISPAK